METEEKYSVWVEGTEVTDHYVDFDTAYYIWSLYVYDDGLEDVAIVEKEAG